MPKRNRNDADYGHAHRRRAAATPKPFGSPCPFYESDPQCPGLLLPGQLLDFDHAQPIATTIGSVGDRWAHRSCNRRAGARLGNRLRKLAKLGVPVERTAVPNTKRWA